MKKVLLLLGTLLLLLAIFVTFFSPDTTLISPISTDLFVSSKKNSNKHNYVILGFAPYWNLKKLSPESLTNITHFAYFHLLLNGDGSIYTRTSKREEDPGYTNYKRLVAGSIDHGTRPLILTFMPESQTALSDSISSPGRRQATIATIIRSMAESKASGVNIDYEPLGDIPPSLRDNFTLFIQDLRIQLNSSNHSLLTISTYASAATKPRIWDMSALAPLTDYFVIMTYDYTMPGSSSAGPNSPLRGSGDLFEHDIIKNIGELTKKVPSTKLLLGIPFYGYEWDTVDDSKYSPSTSRGSVASLERIRSMLNDQTLTHLWDRNTLTPYGISTSSANKKTSQIYFENETSIKLKLDFVKSADLGGIAIWALGYEGVDSWVWPIIHNLNN